MINIQFQPVSQLVVVVVFVSAGCWEPGKRAIFTNSHIGCEKGHKRVALGWAAALRTTVLGMGVNFSLLQNPPSTAEASWWLEMWSRVYTKGKV